MAFKLSDKFFVTWIIFAVESYQPTTVEQYIQLGLAMLIAVIWHYLEDNPLFNFIENKIDYIKENYSFLHGGYKND
jgi:hypothetical protein